MATPNVSINPNPVLNGYPKQIAKTFTFTCNELEDETFLSSSDFRDEIEILSEEIGIEIVVS